MAEIVNRMTSLGIEHEKCNGCKKQFERGETMIAVVSSTNEPMGWFCKNCIDDWKKNGTKSKVFNNG